MNKIKYLSIAILVLLGCYGSANAQTPNDAIMMEGKQVCVLFEYNYGTFYKYWEGSDLRENQTIATVYRNTVMPMAAIGIVDRLNFYIGVPYIKTKSSDPNGGQFAGAKGFQDLTVALKYQILNRESESGTFSLLAGVGFSTPISNYLPDYMPYSLGLGAPELSYRAIAQYEMKNGIYFRGGAAYLWRGYAKAEREYYYNDGSYYTPWMDVPNAITADFSLGTWLLEKSLRVELNYLGSKSTSGDDIRAYNAPQPTNDIEMDRIGVFAHYYFPNIKGLGIAAYHNQVINGKNTARIRTTGIGVTYFFNYLKNKSQ
jgi:hypothetical protein